MTEQKKDIDFNRWLKEEMKRNDETFKQLKKEEKAEKQYERQQQEKILKLLKGILEKGITIHIKIN